MIALIDSDTPVYTAALSAEGLEEWIALSRLDASIGKIIDSCGCSEYKLYVSGGHNFRYNIAPDYKAGRPPSPEHREACKQHLISEWGAIETDGYEADDAVGMAQRDNTMIVGIDKDLLMIPGKHYQWPILRKGVVIREEMFHDITEEAGLKRFFTQMLVGDNSDNIRGIHRVGPVKATKILEDCQTEEGMYMVVKDMYMAVDREDNFHKNLDLLWIWQNYGETYNVRREVRA